MPSMRSNKSVEEFLDTAPAWKPELSRLRKIILATGLDETLKWGGPVYCRGGLNVVGLGGFKSYCGIWFFQGALLKDPDQVLINAQEGRTKALRQWRFTSGKEINKSRITAYLLEAIHLADSGKSIKPDRNKPLLIPKELASALAKNKKANAAFAGLSKGCQREFAEYIDSAKQEATKLRRLEKIIPMILDKCSLNDKYR